jgi:hypothetical protein
MPRLTKARTARKRAALNRTSSAVLDIVCQRKRKSVPILPRSALQHAAGPAMIASGCAFGARAAGARDQSQIHSAAGYKLPQSHTGPRSKAALGFALSPAASLGRIEAN